ncbi:hypothetical protein LTR70_005018 [Exophiala xenobiotica]|uniref:Regulator of volume decrease after cellular swelling-domain-containing protein n=1 Tax=Lithohypha guttulata TaxID=1690604 RepID=A0ABR0KC69_9EURO|nr:hypothetical protein LTR24_004422 [Lithohypha guttulata]KAK5319399.1 hypothetical protein LTR70_005018 [Exophiala xenobiotica]
MEVLREAPETGSFVPLAEHQSTTPASFYSGPPVLHYYSDRCQVIVLEEEVQNAPALASFVSKATAPAHSNEPQQSDETNGSHAAQKTLDDVDIWVTSDKLLLYSKSHSTGISIPYPTISLHAIQSLPTPTATEPQFQGLYMQLIPSVPDTNDEPPDTVSLTIIPTASAPPPFTAPTANEDDAIESEDNPEQTPVMALFTALSDCSNLHPDPVEDEEEQGSRLMQAGLAISGTSDGTMPPPMPGSGGWITAENMHEFIDEDGNFIQDTDETAETAEDGDGELGPGAGTVRGAPDDGKADNDDDTKWQRTS